MCATNLKSVRALVMSLVAVVALSSCKEIRILSPEPNSEGVVHISRHDDTSVTFRLYDTDTKQYLPIPQGFKFYACTASEKKEKVTNSEFQYEGQKSGMCKTKNGNLIPDTEFTVTESGLESLTVEFEPRKNGEQFIFIAANGYLFGAIKIDVTHCDE